MYNVPKDYKKQGCKKVLKHNLKKNKTKTQKNQNTIRHVQVYINSDT